VSDIAFDAGPSEKAGILRARPRAGIRLGAGAGENVQFLRWSSSPEKTYRGPRQERSLPMPADRGSSPPIPSKITAGSCPIDKFHEEEFILQLPRSKREHLLICSALREVQRSTQSCPEIFIAGQQRRGVMILLPSPPMFKAA